MAEPQIPKAYYEAWGEKPPEEKGLDILEEAFPEAPPVSEGAGAKEDNVPQAMAIKDEIVKLLRGYWEEYKGRSLFARSNHETIQVLRDYKAGKISGFYRRKEFGKVTETTFSFVHGTDRTSDWQRFDCRYRVWEGGKGYTQDTESTIATRYKGEEVVNTWNEKEQEGLSHIAEVRDTIARVIASSSAQVEESP